MKWPVTNAIVVPVDFSDLSKEALDAALELADPAAQIRVLHVLPHLSPSEPVLVWEKIDDELRSRHAKTALREWLADEKYRKIQLDVAFGDPGHEIARFAEQVHADLIVMPSHGRSGMARILIGSVAERTLRLAPCPVLVLRKPKSH